MEGPPDDKIIDLSKVGRPKLLGDEREILIPRPDNDPIDPALLPFDLLPLDVRQGIESLTTRYSSLISEAKVTDLLMLVEEYKIEALDMITQSRALDPIVGVGGGWDTIVQTIAQLKKGPLGAIEGNMSSEMERKVVAYYRNIALIAVSTIAQQIIKQLQAKSGSVPDSI